MVFLHGWPDSAKLWTHQVEFFSKDYFCICVNLPQHGEDRSTGWGEDFPQLANRIVNEVKKRIGNSKHKIVLVGHDWGAILAYRIERDYPNWVEKLVTMDVGGHLKPESVGHKLFLVSYQWYLIFAFLVGKISPPVGNFLSRKFARMSRAPERETVRSEMNYLYFYYWRAALLPRYRHQPLKNYQPSRPLLFLYGARNIYPFHSRHWESLLKKLPGCSVVRMEKSGHWLMIKESEKTNLEIRQWLDHHNESTQ